MLLSDNLVLVGFSPIPAIIYPLSCANSLYREHRRDGAVILHYIDVPHCQNGMEFSKYSMPE
jgi:hypothetical protein